MKHLFQPRGKDTGYQFRLAVPRGLWGAFGKCHVVEGLGTDSKAEAMRLRDQRLAYWRVRFEKVAKGAPITSLEIEAEAKNIYLTLRDRLTADVQAGRNSVTDISSYDRYLQERLEQGDWADVAPDVGASCRHLGITLEPDSLDYANLARAILEAKLSAVQDFLLDLEGRAPQTVWPVRDDVAVQQKKRPVKVMPGDGIRFSEAAELMLAEVGSTLRVSTVKAHRRAQRDFVQYAGDPPLNQVTRAMAGEFLTILGRERGSAARTLNGISGCLSLVFNHAIKRGHYDGANPFSDQLFKIGKQDTSALPFTDAEVKVLLADQPKNDLDWALLISAYTGARGNEVAQLRYADLQQHDGIWFFNITEGPGQMLKNKNAARRVPLHSRLLQAELVEHFKSQQGEWMFPSFTPGGPDKKRGRTLGIKFAKYLRASGVERARVHMHSWRKTVATKLDRAAVNTADIAALLGHSRSFSLDVYSGGPGLQRLRDVVERVTY